MDLKLVKKLISLMNENELVEMEIEEEGKKIRLKKGLSHNTQPPAPPLAFESQVPQPALVEAGIQKSKEESEHVFINSPMVGTFYRANSPDAEPYVSPGGLISKDTVLCIIEAMKVMNEIKSDIQGRILEVLVENGEAVEYGQPLFKVTVQ